MCQRTGLGKLVIRPRPSTSAGLGPRRPIRRGEDHYYPYHLPLPQEGGSAE
ncbi:hypothetical protein GW17_00007443, partial [Ensete ventricosum]